MSGQVDSSDRDRYVVERLCLEFEARWQPEGKSGTRIEDYLERVSETQRPQLVEELVAIECELRATHGQMPTRTEYRERFQPWKDAVDSAFGWWQSDSHVSVATQETAPPERLGDYRIVREIGRGGMGVVYEAVQESLDRRVAIKVLAAHPVHHAEIIKRFQRETRAVATLHHSNIVEIHGTGEQDGLYYYAMQLVEGQSLSHVIADRKTGAPALPATQPAEVAEIGLQVARALQYAHSRGVLHRDIKPGNLLLDADGTTWVADFGLAKLLHEEGDATRTENVIGTLRYLPPEAIHGTRDERGDVYSLGLTLYELLTLKPAFDERDTSKLLHEIVRGEPLRPRSINPSIPLDLQTIVLKAAAREPADRYQTSGQMADDLQRFLNGEPIAARRASLPERALKWARRKPTLAALVALVFLVAFVGVPTLTVLWRQAKTAQGKAELEKDRAELEKDNAEASHEDAEDLAYARTTSLAQNSIERLNRQEAEKLLAGTSSRIRQNLAAARVNHTNFDVAASDDSQRDRRGWEWNYLTQQLDSSLLTLTGHSGPVLLVAIRPDDAQIATVGGWEPRTRAPQGPGEVILWDAETGQKQHILRGHQSGVSGASYSRDGRRLATISIGNERSGVTSSIKIWDPETGDLLHTIQRGIPREILLRSQYKPNLAGVQFSPDGQWLVCWPDPIQVRRADTYEFVWENPGIVATVMPGTSHLLHFQVPALQVRELSTGKLLNRLANWGRLFDFAYSSDGKQLSALLNHTYHVGLWNLPDMTKIRDIPTPNIYWGAITPDGEQIVFGDRRGVLHTLFLDDDTSKTHRLGHTSRIVHGAFTHDGKRLVTGGADGAARVWSLEGARWPSVVETDIRGAKLGDIAFDQDGNRILYASRTDPKHRGKYGWLNLEDETQGEHQLNITPWAHWPRTDFAFSHDGKLLAAPVGEVDLVEKEVVGYTRSGKVNVWSTETGEVLHMFELGDGEITSVGWSRDDRMLAVATYDEKSVIAIFEPNALASGVDARRNHPRLARSAQVTIDDHRITAMSFAPQTNQLAASTERGIYLIPPKAAAPAECLQHKESIAFLDYDPAGLRLAAAYRLEQKVRVLDTTTGEVVYEADAPRAVGCVRFSPNGRRLAMVGYDSQVYFCDAEQGHRLITLAGTDEQVGTLAIIPRVIFSRDGRRIAVNDWQGRITVLEAEPGAPLWPENVVAK